MKALVFGGGGAKGSYEVGVWKALRKMNMKFDIVTGASIGSINGAFYAANSYHECLKMWKTVKTSDFFDVNLGSNMTAADYKKLIKELISGGMSFSKAEEFLRSHIDEKKVRNSKTKYGLVTVSLTNKIPRMLTKEQIPYGKLIDYIAASSICYPFVATKDIDNEKFIDGGFYDGIPINLAIDMGATDVLAVDLSVFGTNQKIKDKNVNVDIIKMSNNELITLDFGKKTAIKNINLGYNDTMKHFNKLDGQLYTFKKNSLYKNYQTIEKSYINILKSSLLEASKNKIVNELFNITKFNKLFVKIKNNKLLIEEVNESLEYLGDIFNIPTDKIYGINNYNHLLLKRVDELNYIKINKNLKGKVLIGYIYNKYMTTKNKQNLNRELFNMALICPKELLAAIYLIAISKNNEILLKVDNFYNDILSQLKIK